MNSKIMTFSVLVAILLGCALCNGNDEFENASIKLHVLDSSNRWWIAVDPRDELANTTQVEMKDASSDWTVMMPNHDWGYFQQPSTSGTGFELPLSFRLTAESGEQVTLDDVLTSIPSGSLVDTRTQYSSRQHHKATQAPTKPPVKATQAPTKAPTKGPTQAPTKTPTQAPTKTPTKAPTQAPTKKPTTGSSSSGSLCTPEPTSVSPVELLVPLYIDPGTAWTALVTAAKTGVKIIAIINPNSGPDASGPDSSYVTGISQLKAAGVVVIGYVHTSFGDRALADVEADINTYATKYAGLSGIFLDEASESSSELSYYQSVYNYIMSKSGYVHAIVNPGVVPDQGYLAVSTNIVVFEDTASAFPKASFPSWVTCAPSAAELATYKYKFSGIVNTASASQMPNLVSEMVNNGMGLVYVTDGANGGSTYNSLPSFFAQMSSSVAALN
jgi:hypothetical protein